MMRHRREATFPYQTWMPFDPSAIVLVKNEYGDRRIAQVKDLWWGYATEMGAASEGVIVEAKRLDRPRKPYRAKQTEAAA
jgi:hypothetical protein